MFTRIKASARMALAASLALIAAPAVGQQYQLFSLFNFENGQMPPQLVFGHVAAPETILPISLNLPQLPPRMREGIARTEIGKQCVVFLPEPVKGKDHLSLISNMRMERGRIANAGKALFQADFWLPEEGTATATQALLAITPKEDGRFSYKNYRFGILDGGKRVFFSFANGEPAPTLFESQPISDLNLARPGWHRFQIIFEGQDKIHFAVDAVPTSFSPITEKSLTTLHLGLMVTGTANGSTPMFADNLSIQWSSEAAPLPDSPWLHTAPGSTPTPAADAPGRLLESGNGLTWYTDPSEAWAASTNQKKPLLTLFYAPRIEPYAYLKRITPNDQATQDLLTSHVLLKVDANQLGGGKLAQDYKVYRLPTMITIGLNGRESSRLTISNGRTQWAEIAAYLQPKPQ